MQRDFPVNASILLSPEKFRSADSHCRRGSQALESDTPGKAGGLMSVTVPRTGACRRVSARRLELSALVGYLLLPNITTHCLQLEADRRNGIPPCPEILALEIA